MSGRRRACRPFLLLAAALAGTAAAAPEVVERTVEYEVLGHDRATLSRAIHRYGPRDEQGVPRAGYTAYEYTWRYRFQPAGKRCEVAELAVRFEIEVTLPVWADPERGDAGLRRSWDAFVAALSRHEDGHVALAREAAQELDDALRRTTKPDGCAGFDALLEGLAERLMAAHDARQLEYDRRTDNGLKQGVELR